MIIGLGTINLLRFVLSRLQHALPLTFGISATTKALNVLTTDFNALASSQGESAYFTEQILNFIVDSSTLSGEWKLT